MRADTETELRSTEPSKENINMPLAVSLQYDLKRLIIHQNVTLFSFTTTHACSKFV